ncbi:hypothetical protein FOIG_00960 [Fusarium odoratissimum NRRL 54006]|uniref:Uncharacterized protein n=2 Tax=Fusarium oxysporum species complex TaxID=171631 RepID=X0KR37_FUSO5|nr:uncharacterized protein FOIG_00960 [Fusarium odoratissimum NRRL 54006]EXM11156.1 hypothetical protein FOIG_00960 [Fusarium odoratissimum NRRL 54006]TXC05175.1 hypothetical protein FocTR4_00001195 [Fusarium oxysporum f. sp. cubense]
MGHLHDETDTLFPLCKKNHWITKVFSHGRSSSHLQPHPSPTHMPGSAAGESHPAPTAQSSPSMYCLILEQEPSFTVNDLVVIHTKRPAFSPHAKSCAAIYVVHMS